jgi:sugar phosphate isomerase/epimerase
MYLALGKSYKGLYPFKIGTTSYIYPDRILPNVKMLAKYLDEIEILLFESQARENFPSKAELNALSLMSKELCVSYNIHLPIDIFLGHRDHLIRNQGVETIKQVIDLTARLSPTTYTLHLIFSEDSHGQENVNRWRDLVYKSMEQLFATGIECESISLENLNYPFEWLENILSDFNVSVCMDLGHLIVNQVDMEAAFNRYCHRTSIIHLHGVKNRRDHLSLDRLSNQNVAAVMRILKRFTGVVSLEIFSFKHLDASLKFLEKLWRDKELTTR